MNSKELNRLKLNLTLIILAFTHENTFPEETNPLNNKINISETEINDND